MTVTDKWAGYLSRLDKRVHICMLLTKRMFLVMDKNVGLGLCMSKFGNQGRSLMHTYQSSYEVLSDHGMYSGY